MSRRAAKARFHRNTPTRHRMRCPTCGRSISYTLEYNHDIEQQGSMPRILKAHSHTHLVGTAVVRDACPGLRGCVILGHHGNVGC